MCHSLEVPPEALREGLLGLLPVQSACSVALVAGEWQEPKEGVGGGGAASPRPALSPPAPFNSRPAGSLSKWTKEHTLCISEINLASCIMI